MVLKARTSGHLREVEFCLKLSKGMLRKTLVALRKDLIEMFEERYPRTLQDWKSGVQCFLEEGGIF